MNCEQCTEWLGDAVDGTLSPERQAQVEAHCGGCESCRDLLNDLKEIRAAACRARPVHPFTGLVERDRGESGACDARLSRSMGAAGGSRGARDDAGHRRVVRSRLEMAPGAERRTAATLARNAAIELQLAEQHYQNAITSLEQLTVDRDSALDPAVAAEIALSLQSIDRAIADSRAALKAEPDSFVAQTSLLEALRMKVALLQETVTLMNARS